MILGITGNRPEKCGGYSLPNPTYNYIVKELKKKFIELEPEKIIVGMAQGVDQWAAYLAFKMGIPFLAAIPFEGQESIWPEKSKEIYCKLLDKAEDRILVSSGGFSANKMQIRNEWIVDHSDVMIAVYDGAPSGTANCVNYAKSLDKEIIVINTKEISK